MGNNIENKDLREARRRVDSREVFRGAGGSSHYGKIGNDDFYIQTITTRDATVAEVVFCSPIDARVFVASGTSKRNTGEPFDYVVAKRMAAGRAFLELGMRLLDDAYSRLPDEVNRNTISVKVGVDISRFLEAMNDAQRTLTGSFRLQRVGDYETTSVEIHEPEPQSFWRRFLNPRS